MVLLSILAFLCPPTWSAWRECWLSTPVSCDHMTRDGIVHLDCYSIKIFSLLGVLSALTFILWGCCRMVLLSIFGFSLSAHVTAWRECWLSTPVLCDHMNQKMGYCTPWLLGVVKYFHLLGVLSALIFIPLVLLSSGAFGSFWLFSVCKHDRMTTVLIVHTCIMWSHDQRWDIVHLDFFSSKMSSSFGFFVHALIFILRGCCPMVLLFIFSFLCPPTWSAWWECWLSTPVSCDHMNRNGIVHLDCWSIEIFSLLIFLSALIFILWGFVLCCFFPLWLFSVRPHDRMTRTLIFHTCIMCQAPNRRHVQRKAKMDKSTIGQKIQRIKIKADKTPKRENILKLQQLRCTIPFLFVWSHDAGVDNQHSRHAITWVDKEKPKWTKAPSDKSLKG